MLGQLILKKKQYNSHLIRKGRKGEKVIYHLTDVKNTVEKI